MKPPSPVHFATPAKLRAWLKRRHASATEAWVGLYKRETGKPSITWPELVDQVLCFGWIDGIRKRVDEESYMIRITPRRKGSNWSMVNLRRARELIELGLMEPAGLAAYEARDEGKAKRYSYEREQAALPPAYLKELRTNRRAWAFFGAQPPSYRKLVTHWIASAKREDTRRRRFDTLVQHAEKGLRIDLLKPGRAPRPGPGRGPGASRAPRPTSGNG